MNEAIEFVKKRLEPLAAGLSEREYRYNDIAQKAVEVLNSYGYVGIGGGICSYVYQMPGSDFVIKVNYDYINLNCHPTKEIWDAIVRNGHRGRKESMEEYCFYKPFEVEHFLFFEYVSPQGFFAVQRFVDVSLGAIDKAAGLFREVGMLNFLRQNIGMDGNRPVIIDWW